MNDQTLTNEELLKEFKRLLKESDKVTIENLNRIRVSDEIAGDYISKIHAHTQEILKVIILLEEIKDKINKEGSRIISMADFKNINNAILQLAKQEFVFLSSIGL